MPCVMLHSDGMVAVLNTVTVQFVASGTSSKNRFLFFFLCHEITPGEAVKLDWSLRT